MKKIKEMKEIKIWGLISMLLFVTACNLERDNPLDVNGTKYELNNSTTGNNNVVTEKGFKEAITFVRYWITSKRAKEDFHFTTNQTINSGDEIYLQVYLRNSSSKEFGNLTGTFSTESTLISIEPTESGYSRVFHNDGPWIFKFSGGEGYGEITDTKGSFDLAPNGAYAVKFTVSNDAKSGDVIPLKLKLYSGTESKDFDMNLKID